MEDGPSAGRRERAGWIARGLGGRRNSRVARARIGRSWGLGGSLCGDREVARTRIGRLRGLGGSPCGDWVTRARIGRPWGIGGRPPADWEVAGIRR